MDSVPRDCLRKTSAVHMTAAISHRRGQRSERSQGLRSESQDSLAYDSISGALAKGTVLPLENERVTSRAQEIDKGEVSRV